MSKEKRYRVRDSHNYDKISGSDLKNVDILYIDRKTQEKVVVQEVDNKRGKGDSNEIPKSEFDLLLKREYIVEANV